MGLGLITAVYGGYDHLRALPDGHGFADAVCVTDDPQLQAHGWRMIVEPTSLPPRLAAKRPKFLPFEYLTTSSAVWIDAAFSLREGRFHDFAVEHLERHEFVVWQHPEPRNCLYQEAAYCQDWPKYAREPIRRQTAHYRELGMPEHFGLFAAGTLGWRDTESMREFGAAWLAECHEWSIQDQVSLPFLLWRLNVTPGIWQAHEFANDMLDYHQHTRNE